MHYLRVCAPLSKENTGDSSNQSSPTEKFVTIWISTRVGAGAIEKEDLGTFDKYSTRFAIRQVLDEDLCCACTYAIFALSL